ncbi:unnamed protein product, partial [Rotaria sp. Silwood1]
MSGKAPATNGNNGIDAPFLSSKHKVMQYLQNSACCSTNTNNNSLVGHQKTSPHTHDLFYAKDTSINNNHNQRQKRMHSCSENSSGPSTLDTLSRFDFSYGSSLSDPGGHCSTFSSNTSSSGIYSTFSDVRHEEGTSTSSEDLDFNLGFEQISDNDDFEVANLDEIDEYDEYELNEGDNQRISNNNSGSTATLLDFDESNSNAYMNKLEGFLRKSLSSTTINGNVESNNDDTITDNQIKQQQCGSLLDESIYTLCSPDRFSVYSENDDYEKDTAPPAITTRSNSVGFGLLNRKPALLDKPTKKVVRFADMLGLDLESIRYMTPPDQSANLLMQECFRIKLEQLR